MTNLNAPMHLISSLLVLISISANLLHASGLHYATGGQPQPQLQAQADQLAFEQQFAAALQQQFQPTINHLIPTSGNAKLVASQHQHQQPVESTASSPATPAARSRSPRSIGEMFKKFFNGNKRSKHSSSTSSSSNNRDWEQQQQHQQQQQQQLYQHNQQQQQLHHQHQQNQLAAAHLAAAAANQHAVYASPFATSPIYTQAATFATPYSSQAAAAGLLAWPTANLAQALRAAAATPTLIASPAASAPMALATSSAPLYAAASQSYNSYAPAPAGPSSGSSMVSGGGAGGGPQAAASHAHASAVPAPPNMAAGASSPQPTSGLNSLDFHQVLDALVRTSGFAPAGDAEAAAAAGYGSKSEGTPVFSFKKLVSLPFYLSTEDKSLDGLAGASGGPAQTGYSLHSMPIMRRHVRRMSTNQHLQQAQHPSSSYYLPAESAASMQQYTNYINGLNSQFAASVESSSSQQNQQIMNQFLSSQQQPVGQPASSADAYAAESALANYYASMAQSNAGQYKASGIGSRISPAPAAAGGLATSASMVAPTAVQPPQSLIQQQQQQQQVSQLQSASQRHFEQQQELQSLINNVQQQLSTSEQLVTGYPFGGVQLGDGHRFGATQQLYWPASGQQQEAGSLSGAGQQQQGAMDLSGSGQQAAGRQVRAPGLAAEQAARSHGVTGGKALVASPMGQEGAGNSDQQQQQAAPASQSGQQPQQQLVADGTQQTNSQLGMSHQGAGSNGPATQTQGAPGSASSLVAHHHHHQHQHQNNGQQAQQLQQGASGQQQASLGADLGRNNGENPVQNPFGAAQVAPFEGRAKK